MTIEAYAKVNLTLEVFGKRTDGYHALRSLVAPITLSDTLEIEPTDDGSLTCDTGFADDLCIRAASVLMSSVSRLPSHSGARIRVMKRIPVGGGLGGGSADAAATLRALNELWELGKSPDELAEIGSAVGSDVPALVLAQHHRAPVLMEGRGERVSRGTGDVPDGRLVLANPGIVVSTAEIYRLCVPRTVPATDAVNDLQEAAVRRHPEIGRTLSHLKAAGATNVMMSGSGATCFGFAPDAPSVQKIAEQVARSGNVCWVVGFVRTRTANSRFCARNGRKAHQFCS